MHINLDTNLLRTLIAVGDTGNFSRTAAQLSITQSAVTLRVQKLEHILHRALVHRSRGGVALTDEGRVLVQYARKILELNDEAVEHIANGSARESIAIGVIEEFERVFLEEFLTSFHKTYPRVRIDVIVDYSRNLKRLLEDDKICLAILKSGVAESQGVALYEDLLVWVASKNPLPVTTKRPIPLVVSPAPCVNRAVMIKALDAAGLPWRIISSSPTLSGVVVAVKAGLGVSAIDLRSVQPTMQVLTERDGFPPLPNSRVALLRRPGRVDRLLDHLISELKDFVRQKDGAEFLPHLHSVPIGLEIDMGISRT
jgi:DNA-binding transcriptional LysR family regulator